MKGNVNRTPGTAFAPRRSPSCSDEGQGSHRFVDRLSRIAVDPQPKCSGVQTTKGVTLIELLVTVAVAMILLGVAVPSFQNIIRTNRIAALTNELTTALQLARSEAVTRGTRVTVCKSATTQTANPTCSTSTDAAVWRDGWIVFVDANADGSLDAGEILLRVGQPSVNGASITTNDTNFNGYIGFVATGASVGANGTGGGSVSICIAPNQRQIGINMVGRLSVSKASCT